VNRLKDRLGAREVCLGLLISMPSVPLVQLAARSGLDWLFIDMEHGPIGIESAHAMVAATQGTDCTPVIRTPHAETWLSQPALDSGAFGIVHPMINDRASAEAAVRSQNYPPGGARGVGPFYAAARFGLTVPDYLAAANDSVLCVVQIEHKDAVADIDDIIAVEGVDAIFVGPADLTASLGHGTNTGNPDTVAAIERVAEACTAKGMGMGIDCASPEHMARWHGLGYRFFTFSADIGYLDEGARTAVAAARAAVP